MKEGEEDTGEAGEQGRGKREGGGVEFGLGGVLLLGGAAAIGEGEVLLQRGRGIQTSRLLQGRVATLHVTPGHCQQNKEKIFFTGFFFRRKSQVVE